ncbi:MAG TPA: hypothetical protein VD885_04665, partial [Methylophilaceae bacterium]|nr:hypothetical protein [Methylophilaceae bacterium]
MAAILPSAVMAASVRRTIADLKRSGSGAMLKLPSLNLSYHQKSWRRQKADAVFFDLERSTNGDTVVPRPHDLGAQEG